MADEIETVNDCLVGIRGDGKVFVALPPTSMDREKALRLAAWLVAVVGDRQRFDAIYAAVLKT